MKTKPWFVYIIETEKGLLYTGVTTDIQRRFEEHSKKKGGAKFFNIDAPKNFLYLKKVESRSQATKIEISIKKLSKKQKLDLISDNRFETKRLFSNILGD